MGEKGDDEGALLGGVEAFKCRVAVASTLVGALGTTRVFRWRANCGGRGRYSNGELSWVDRWMRARITHRIRVRFGYPKTGWGVIISPGAEAPTGAQRRSHWYLNDGRDGRVPRVG